MSLASKLVKVQQHIPLIRFRKGSLNPVERMVVEPAVAVPELLDAPVLHAATQGAPVSGGNIEWWDLPLRYRRPVVDEQECEAINGGGSDKLWS